MSLREEVTTENDISEVPVVSTNTSSALYDRKRHSKAIRVLTVLAYVLSVSLAAILLSIYYVFVWDGHPTLAAKRPQAQTAWDLDLGVPQVEISEEMSRKRDTAAFINRNESFSAEMITKDLVRKRTGELSGRSGGKGKEGEKECGEKEEKEEQDESGFFNNSENSTLLTVNNDSLNLDDYRMELRDPEPTMDYEDSTFYTTPPGDENSTWFSELDDFNADYGIIDKRSIFMKKLLGHHNTMPK